MSEEIKVDAYIAKAKSLGYNIFYGKVDSSSKPQVYWDTNQGDYIKFLKLGRELGLSILVVDRFILYDDDLDALKLNPEDFSNAYKTEIQEINSEIENFRKYAGKTGAVSLSWFYEGAVFSYFEGTDWARDYFEFSKELHDMLDEIFAEMDEDDQTKS